MCQDDNNGLFDLVDEVRKNLDSEGDFIGGGYPASEDEENILPPEGIEEDDND